MRFRLRSLLSHEVARFAGVGVVNTALDLTVYVLLDLIGVPILVANLISTSTGLCFSFTANRAFTFRRRSRARSQILLFVLCTGVGLWVVQPLVILAVQPLMQGTSIPAGLAPVVAKTIAIGIGMVWNWTFYNRIVFRHRELTHPAPGRGAAIDPA